MRLNCLLDQEWLGKGRRCKLWHLLEMVQTGNLCASSAFKDWNSFHCLHAHIREAWQKGGCIGRAVAGENSELRKASPEHTQRAG